MDAPETPSRETSARENSTRENSATSRRPSSRMEKRPVFSSERSSHERATVTPADFTADFVAPSRVIQDLRSGKDRVGQIRPKTDGQRRYMDPSERMISCSVKARRDAARPISQLPWPSKLCGVNRCARLSLSALPLKPVKSLAFSR